MMPSPRGQPLIGLLTPLFDQPHTRKIDSAGWIHGRVNPCDGAGSTIEPVTVPCACFSGARNLIHVEGSWPQSGLPEKLAPP